MKPSVALIGYGRFGKFAAGHLTKKFSVSILESRTEHLRQTPYPGIMYKDLSKSKIVILAVPINKLRSTLKKISPNLAPGTLVCDVCSVKEQPMKWMKELLPRHVSFLGLHPLFGPDSAADSLKNKVMVICSGRISSRKLNRVKRYFRASGLHVFQTTPSHHDKTMASSLFLTQFIGRALRKFPAWDTLLTTKNFLLLREIIRTTGRDSEELFRDMYRYNRFAKNIPSRIIAESKRLTSVL